MTPHENPPAFVEWCIRHGFDISSLDAKAAFDDDFYSTQNMALAAALKLFADFADKRGIIPSHHIITQGSSFAKRQLTMGDCLRAEIALNGHDAMLTERQRRKERTP